MPRRLTRWLVSPNSFSISSQGALLSTCNIGELSKREQYIVIIPFLQDIVCYRLLLGFARGLTADDVNVVSG